MNRVEFNTYLRSILGRRYSVADDEGGTDGVLRLILLRRGAEQSLVIETADAWIGSLQNPPLLEDRMLLKHLSIYAKRYFAHPEYLRDGAFVWPGTTQSRSSVRLALDPRKSRRITTYEQGG